VKPSLVVKALDTPPGDDTLVFKGRVTIPHPFAPTLDPSATGIGLLITDATGTRVLDLELPSGAYDRLSGRGWRGSWKYIDRSDDPPAGITRVAIRDLSKKSPGLVQFSVKGRRGAYIVDPTNLPLTGLFVLDPPTAETGQCAQASFPRCTASGRAVECR
jgi:hypothetical protein